MARPGEFRQSRDRALHGADIGREFLDLLVSRDVLGIYALSQHFAWTARESAEVRGLRDQLVLKVALDSSLAPRRTLARTNASKTTPHPTTRSTVDSLGELITECSLAAKGQQRAAQRPPA
jgi:uncharacterized membrane protein